MSDASDAEEVAWVAAMAEGDDEAFARLYDRHCDLLFGLALRILGDRREAEDVLHNVFLEVWRSARDYDPKRARVRTWLTVRMRSRALDVLKSARVRRNAGDAALERMSGDMAPANADHARVRAALAQLSVEQRRVIELMYFDGLSCSEIAARIAIPVGTVKSRLSAGLQRLRECLERPQRWTSAS
jgi:RNA polymerase sigma-70 factor (ECF subfamily)